MISDGDAVDVDALFKPLSTDKFIGSDNFVGVFVLFGESSCGGGGEIILFSVLCLIGVVDCSRTVVCSSMFGCQHISFQSSFNLKDFIFEFKIIF